ncbi:unnamed protein product, partial [Cylindrotheca closterium]
LPLNWCLGEPQYIIELYCVPSKCESECQEELDDSPACYRSIVLISRLRFICHTAGSKVAPFGCFLPGADTLCLDQSMPSLQGHHQVPLDWETLLPSQRVQKVSLLVTVVVPLGQELELVGHLLSEPALAQVSLGTGDLEV